ncbi:MAG: condensation domain-containing protein, partial [Gemmatimonadaceae bacterium]
MTETTSAADLRRALLQKWKRLDGTGNVGSTIQARPRSERCPASFAQRRLWFLQQLEPDSAAYTIPSALRFTGHLDLSGLEEAFRSIISRHEALRTGFSLDGDAVYQEISEHFDFACPLVDLSHLPAAEQRAAVATALDDTINAHFDLTCGPLLQARVLRLGVDDHVLLLALHHIAGDTWSMGVLLRELGALYGAGVEGRPAGLAPLPVQYGDYAYFEQAPGSQARLGEQLAYWRAQLAGAPAVVALPTDRPRPAVARHQGAVHRFEIPVAVAHGLRALVRAEGATLAAFAARIALEPAVLLERVVHRDGEPAHAERSAPCTFAQDRLW